VLRWHPRLEPLVATLSPEAPADARGVAGAAITAKITQPMAKSDAVEEAVGVDTG